MTQDTNYNILAALAGVALCTIIFGLVAWFKSAQCSAQWVDSGMAHRWGPVQGCMVRRNDGTWIPATAYREVAP
jgi:hypothetical protein